MNPIEYLTKYYSVPDGMTYAPSWADHVNDSTQLGRSVWRSQPYTLDDRAFDDFAILRAHSYHIRIQGKAEHHPDCMTVTITGSEEAMDTELLRGIIDKLDAMSKDIRAISRKLEGGNHEE